MTRLLSSNRDNQQLFAVDEDPPVCIFHISNFLPLEQFIDSIVPLRSNSGHIWNMALIETTYFTQWTDKDFGRVVERSIVVTSFGRTSRQCFHHLSFSSHSSRQTFEEDSDFREDQIDIAWHAGKNETEFGDDPDLHICYSDLLRAKEIQQQSIMTWIMSARFAHLLIPQRDMQFQTSVTRAASVKKRKFRELRETSVYKWVAHPLMDRNLIRLVLSFVR